MRWLGCSETKVHTKVHFSGYIFDKLELHVKQQPEKVRETFMEKVKVLVKQTSL